MASLYAVWVPAIVIAHVLAIALFVYSLNQVGLQLHKLLGKHGKDKDRKDGKKDENGKSVAELHLDSILCSTSSVELDVCLLESPPPASLQWSGLIYQVRDEATGEPKVVLKGCGGKANCGETVALMGPSGAGKTTLLDVLAGRIRGSQLQGTLTLNEKPAGKKLKRYSQYVTQEDVFVATQTTFETLQFRAGLCMPATISQNDRLNRINTVVDVMGLTKVKHSKVGGLLPGGIAVRGISGGEKRRLSIACALLSNPSILFLDEPTTGLDSFAALSVMEHMSQLACAGHTIIASIHQPRADIFARFNKIVILSEGYQVYAGCPSRSVDWFSTNLNYKYNTSDGAVSDWIMDTVSVSFAKPKDIAKRSMTSLANIISAAEQFKAYTIKNGADDLMLPTTTLPASLVASRQDSVSCDLDSTAPAQRTRSTALLLETVSDINGGKPAHLADKNQWASEKYAVRWHRQYLVLLKRSVLSQVRNPTDTANRLLIATWVGIASGLVFASLPEGVAGAHLRLSSQFFMLLLFMLLPFTFMSFFVADRRFYQSDVAAGLYAPSAYYLAAVTASTPPVIVNTICGGLLAYGLTGLRYTWYAIVMYLVVLVFQALISQQLLIFCVWLTPNQDMAYTIATGYVAVSILLAGFYIRISAIKAGFIRGLSWLSYTKYSMQAMGRIELLGRVWSPEACNTTGPTGGVNGPQHTTCITQGNSLVDYYGFTVDTGVLIAALATAFILLHLGSYLALSRLHKGHK